jgi:uncharacterized protein YndB with AHSA1/START domain
MAAIGDTAPASSAWELAITRSFDAPRGEVFQAWADPARIVRWWGPRGFRIPSCRMDVREGGAWRVCMRSPEGTDHWVQGVFREVAEPDRLAFTWAWEDEQGKPGHETVVKVDFTERHGRTRMIVQQGTFESQNARERHEEGWSSCFDRLEDHLRGVDEQSER